MFDLARDLWNVLTPLQRKRALMLTGAVIVMAVLEILNVSAIAPFLTLASDPTMVAENQFLGYLYDVLGFESINLFLVYFGIGVFLLMLLSNAWSALTAWAQLRLVWSWNHELSVRLLKSYLNRPYSYFLSRNTADLSKNLLSEVEQVTNQMLRPVIVAMGRAVVAMGIVLVLIVMDPVLAFIVSVVVGGGYGVVYALTRRRLNSIGQDRVKANKERFTIAGEALGGIKDVKVLNVESEFLERFIAPSRRFSWHQATSQTIAALPRYAIETVAFGTVILIVVYLMAVESDFRNIVPTLGLYAFAGYRLMPALQQVFSGIAAARFYSSALHTVLNDLKADEDEGVHGWEGGSSEQHKRLEATPSTLASRRMLADERSLRLDQKLELRNITFSYPNADRPAVKNVSLTIPVKSAVGIIGATGSGKTTLVDIVLGLLRPQEGEILVDGVPVTRETLRAWQKCIGYVPQHIFLADASVAENIAFGLPKDAIDIEAVRRAAKIAQIDDFVMNDLPYGYETVVGERGLRLSGGQRQRIGIARALYRDPDVIIFDEATSALDNTTESHLMDAVANMLGKKTLIMIAHRLTTLANTDRIYVMSNGAIVGERRYEELSREKAIV